MLSSWHLVIRNPGESPDVLQILTPVKYGRFVGAKGPVQLETSLTNWLSDLGCDIHIQRISSGDLTPFLLQPLVEFTLSESDADLQIGQLVRPNGRTPLKPPRFVTDIVENSDQLVEMTACKDLPDCRTIRCLRVPPTTPINHTAIRNAVHDCNVFGVVTAASPLTGKTKRVGVVFICTAGWI